MNAPLRMPPMSVAGDEDRAKREQRLERAYRAMNDVVAALWPRVGEARDPDAVRWRGAIVSLHEVDEQLVVSWRDEDHFDKFAKVAELAWDAAGQEGAPVVHENADIDGLELESVEHLY